MILCHGLLISNFNSPFKFVIELYVVILVRELGLELPCFL